MLHAVGRFGEITETACGLRRILTATGRKPQGRNAKVLEPLVLLNTRLVFSVSIG